VRRWVCRSWLWAATRSQAQRQSVRRCVGGARVADQPVSCSSAPAMVSAGRRWRSFAKTDDALLRPESDSEQELRQMILWSDTGAPYGSS
jgi:hypothetical protein